MKLYIIPFWIPFPTSEYGGVQIFKANNSNEILEYLTSKANAYERKNYPDYFNLIKEAISEATIFELVPSSNDNFELVHEFIT